MPIRFFELKAAWDLAVAPLFIYIAYIGLTRNGHKSEQDELIVTAQHPARLLTTRVRITLALALTGFVLVQDIRGLRLGHTESGWFLGAPLFHGWALIAVSALFYGYVCWLAFWFIRGTAGPERVFFGGWSVGIVLWPIKMLLPHWAIPMKHIGAVGLSVAVLAALALLQSNNIARTSDPNFIDQNIKKT